MRTKETELPDETQEKAEQIFFDVVELPVNERESFIDEQCGDNESVRAIVTSLLQADQAAGAGDFLASQFLAGADIQSTPADLDDSDPEDQLSQDGSRFKILSRHQEGGLGEVLLAHDRQLNRQVAVKQIRPKWLDHHEARERFVQEAEVTGHLEHPGVVPVYALGTWDDGRPFYAMRFIQGQTLKEVIAESRKSSQRSNGRVSTMELRGLLNRFVSVCNTIEYAHSRRILHRDIKPSNVMVGPYGETLVVDWGLAKLLDAKKEMSLTEACFDGSSKSGSSRTRIGGTVGTPQYMSPEQASGDLDSIGIRTDVYLLGATLYQILTGVPPHSEESVSKLIERIKQGILRRPRDVDSEIPAALEAVCLKAMAKEPYDRYPSAANLSADVEKWLADEPVAVFRDPLAVRLGRWGRKNRTLAISGSVAAVLMMLGSVIGSLAYSYQRTQQLKLERERNVKESQLIASRQQRLLELADSAGAAIEMSDREIRADRLLTALSILRRAERTLAGESEFATQRQKIVDRAYRIERIVTFRNQGDMCEQFNVTSRDTQGIMAATAGLKALGIWDQSDWWMHLPDQDLTPLQKDQLRQDVYQQWLMLDGMLVKTIGTRLFGATQNGKKLRLMPGLRRIISSDAGKREAAAALVASDRVDFFRQAECARWYRSVARFRLGTGRRIKGKDLGSPRNAADAQKLGILCMLSAMDPSFEVVFRDYQNKDPMQSARDLFQRSAAIRPDHYWTQLTLAQMQYFMAERQANPTWQSYQPAVQTMGRCLAINPKSCFAFADRSMLTRFQYQLLSDEVVSSTDDSSVLGSEFLRTSVEDAQTAYRLGEDQPWVGWSYGLALAQVEQIDQAIEVMMKASLLTHPLMARADSTLINADDLRGRSEAAKLAKEMMGQDPNDSVYQILLASIRLNQQRYAESLEQVELAIAKIDEENKTYSAHAYAVRGMNHLNAEKFGLAKSDFQESIDRNPGHLWARYGIAACFEAMEQDDLALEQYDAAIQLAATDEHRAACLLGKGRTLATMGQYQQSKDMVVAAQQLQPACDIAAVGRPLVERLRVLKSAGTNPDLQKQLVDFLRTLAKLPRVSKIEFGEPKKSNDFVAPILNGDFELGAFSYWSDEQGIAWRNESGYLSGANVVRTTSHSGRYSLHISGAAVNQSEQSRQSGSTSQQIPVPEKCAGRISIWAKARETEPGAVRVVIENLETKEILASLELAAGSYDWSRFEKEFYCDEVLDPTWTVVPVSIRLESAGRGEVWLDDVEMRVDRSAVR